MIVDWLGGLTVDPETQPYFKIGEMAKFFNVSVKALRIYEKKGIITPAKTDSYTGYRYYTIDQVNQINALLELKSLGFLLSETKEVISGNKTSNQMITLLMNKRMVWQDTKTAAEYKMKAIDSIIKRISKSQNLLISNELTDEQRAWLLIKMICIEDIRMQKLLNEAIWL